MSILDDLRYRELLYQCTDEQALAARLADGPTTLYIGFDPTADSLHVGSLLQILCLRRFQLAGHRPIALVGGGTGLIGDPSGKANERTLNSVEVVRAWSDKIRAQLEGLLDFTPGPHAARLVNNYDWLGRLQVIEFLRDIGKNFSISSMIGRESVRARLETGISFTEFTYQVLQAYDFLMLFKEHGCELQAGGSDQWGNITAGIDLIRRETGRVAYGVTFALVTKSDGTKFGKTEQGTIWLDAAKTSPYQFYQFWINAEDRDVVRFLKYYTFLDRDTLESLAGEVAARPEERKAQAALAWEMTRLVHGEAAAARARRISESLFSGDVKGLAMDEIEEGLSDVPSCDATGRGDEVGLLDLLAESGLCPSKRQAREDVKSGAVYVNGERCADLGRRLGAADRMHGRFTILRRGKKNYCLVRWEKPRGYSE